MNYSNIVEHMKIKITGVRFSELPLYLFWKRLLGTSAAKAAALRHTATKATAEAAATLLALLTTLLLDLVIFLLLVIGQE